MSDLLAKADNRKPIREAVTKVLALFDEATDDVNILFPQDAPEEIEKYWPNHRRVIYFESLINCENDKWLRDKYHFWCGLFKRLGIGHEGFDISDVSTPQASSRWLKSLYDCISKHSKKPKSASVPQLIEDKNYSMSRVAHGSSERDAEKLGLAYMITAFRESVLWKFKPNITEKLRILIIDDRLYYSDRADDMAKIGAAINKLLSVCEALPVSFYGLIENDKLIFADAIKLLVDRPKDCSADIWTCCKELGLPKTPSKYFDSIDCELAVHSLFCFDYILVDLWDGDTSSVKGLGLISDLHHAFQEQIRKNTLTFDQDKKDKDRAKNSIVDNRIPEIFAYSIADDTETIQMAHRMGASGYVAKKMPESLVLAIVRSGKPLNNEEATRLDWLCTNNFPAISRVPRQIVKDLLESPLPTPRSDGTVEENNDVKWLRKIPKADLHIHYGTAVPLKWCYILSFISLMHWKLYWSEKSDNETFTYAVKIATDIRNIIDCAVTMDPEGKAFRRNFLECFSKKYALPEVVFLRDVVEFLKNLTNEKLSEKQIACIINVLLAERVYIRSEILSALNDAKQRLMDLKGALENNDDVEDELKIHNLIFFRDCRYVIQNLLSESFYDKDQIRDFEKTLPFHFEIRTDIERLSFDPLSLMLSTDIVEHPYGLERYLAASDLVGSTLMQFADTILLASISIPEWAASCKKATKGKSNLGSDDDSTPCENVVHMELRTTPQGFLEPYRFKMKDHLIASKLICVGLEFAIRYLLRPFNGVSINLLFSIKRDRERESIEELIRMAIDMRDEYRRYLDLNRHISDVRAYLIPHVAGLDVAGIERGNLPEELRPYFREAFDRCLLSTIHAGETEPSKSIKDAVFLLSASRIGHGLSMKKDTELKRMVADRRICVELCPKSNQFTNGFSVFSAGHHNNNCYVYDDYRGKLLMTVNSDNPTISHKANKPKELTYPLAIDYIWLAGMIDVRKSLPLSRLEALYLAYNGFCAMFASEQVKHYKISIADDEVLALLAEDYLDIELRDK